MHGSPMVALCRVVVVCCRYSLHVQLLLLPHRPPTLTSSLHLSVRFSGDGGGSREFGGIAARIGAVLVIFIR